MYDIATVRNDFPLLNRTINGKPNTFLDSAASAQKPQSVIDKIVKIYQNSYANVHRGSYLLSEEITSEYEQARVLVQKFLHASSSKEIVFTRNATESINLVAYSWGRKFLHSGDEVLISEAEHHANLIPWQILRDEIGIKLRIFKINDDGSYNSQAFQNLLSERTKLVAVTGMSNVLGTIFPLTEIIKSAHLFGAKVLVDACQYVVHIPTDVQALDCDFLAFSGHKTYGPTGIGVLYGKADLLAQMPPYQVGGDMVNHVSYETTTFDEPPARFEAGTPAIVQAIGLGEALRYMMNLGMENIFKHENELVKYAHQCFADIKDFVEVGTSPSKGGVFAFRLGNIHPQDLSFLLDKEGIAVRVGHHCAEPLVHRMGYESLARASLGLYSSRADIDNFVIALKKAQTFF